MRSPADTTSHVCCGRAGEQSPLLTSCSQYNVMFGLINAFRHYVQNTEVCACYVCDIMQNTPFTVGRIQDAYLELFRIVAKTKTKESKRLRLHQPRAATPLHT